MKLTDNKILFTVLMHIRIKNVCRCFHYCNALMYSVIKENQVRLGEHTDYGSITLLFQRDIAGLQV